MTAQDIIYGALRDINAIASGETPNADELADCLFALNTLIASWNNEQLSIFTITNYTHALSATVGSYTIGTGGDFDTQRPEKIVSAGIVRAGLRFPPLQLATQGQWANIVEKNAQAQVATVLYDDREYPLATLHLWPVPIDANATIDLYMWQELESFTSVDDNFDFPPGYARAMRKNLAVDLALEFGRPLTQELLLQAQQSKADLTGIHMSDRMAVEPSQVPPPPQPAQQ